MVGGIGGVAAWIRELARFVFQLIQGPCLIAPRGEILIGCPMLKVHSWSVAKLACGTLVGYFVCFLFGLGKWALGTEQSGG